MEIRIIKAADQEQVITLYMDAGWWKADDKDSLDLIDKIVTGSTCFAGAFSGKKMIGMGRALSDGVSDAYIQDVVVLTSYRGQGIGKKIIKALVSDLTNNGIKWIGLIGEPGTDLFYERLGFKRMEQHTPFLYEP